MCAILGIIVSVAWLQLSRLAPRYRLEGAARTIAAEIQKARGQAISNSQCVRVTLNATNRTYRIDTVRTSTCSAGSNFANGVEIKVEDTGTITLENALSLGSDPPAPIFNSRGANLQASNIRLSNVLGDARVVNVNTVGRVNVQ